MDSEELFTKVSDKINERFENRYILKCYWEAVDAPFCDKAFLFLCKRGENTSGARIDKTVIKDTFGNMKNQVLTNGIDQYVQGLFDCLVEMGLESDLDIHATRGGHYYAVFHMIHEFFNNEINVDMSWKDGEEQFNDDAFILFSYENTVIYKLKYSELISKMNKIGWVKFLGQLKGYLESVI